MIALLIMVPYRYEELSGTNQKLGYVLHYIGAAMISNFQFYGVVYKKHNREISVVTIRVVLITLYRKYSASVTCSLQIHLCKDRKTMARCVRTRIGCVCDKQSYMIDRVRGQSFHLVGSIADRYFLTLARCFITVNENRNGEPQFYVHFDCISGLHDSVQIWSVISLNTC